MAIPLTSVSSEDAGFGVPSGTTRRDIDRFSGFVDLSTGKHVLSRCFLSWINLLLLSDLELRFDLAALKPSD